MDKECDGTVDCSDKSDEIDCEMIRIGKTYLKESSPPVLEAQRLSKSQKLLITTKCFLNTIVHTHTLRKFSFRTPWVWVRHFVFFGAVPK